MKAKRMHAKYPGTCGNCPHGIKPGQEIYWTRGRAVHVDCELAKLQANGCNACSGRGYHWSGLCPSCDGTGSRKVQDFARSGGHGAIAQEGGAPC